MKIPSMLYGRAEAVRARARKAAKRLLDNGDLETFATFDPEPFVETSGAGGLLLLRPEFHPLPDDNFHCYALTLAIFDLVPVAKLSATLDSWIEWSFEEPWRFLGVVDQHTTMQLDRNRALLVPYVEAAAKFWPIFEAEGPRYGPFLSQPEGPWRLLRNVQFALVNLGIPSSELDNAPPGGPASLLHRIKPEDRSPS